MTIPASISLVDYSHMISVAFHGVGPEQASDTVLEQLSSLRSSSGHVVVCLDSKPYRRTALYDGYKAGRKQDPELSAIWDRTLQRVTDAGYNLARAPGEEGDDCLATLAHIYSEEYGCTDVRLVTADKDVAQCINDKVRWFVPQLGKRDEFEIRTAQWVQEHFGNVDWIAEKKVGPTPAEVPLVQAICGDTGDKIPGVKGIGIKGAVGLVKTFATVEGMVQGLIAEQNACKLKGKDLAAFWRNFAAGVTDIPKWLALTTLRTDAELELHPLKYLDVILPKAVELADDDIEREAIAGEFTEEDFPGEPTAEELEAERLAMAAALPVEPARTHAAGADNAEFLAASQRSAADRQVAASRALDSASRAETMDRVSKAHPTVPLESVKEIVNTQWAQNAPRVGKDPNADEFLKKAAAARATGGVFSEQAAQGWERKAAGTVDESGRPKAAPVAAAPEPAPSVAPSASAGASGSPAPDAEIVPKTQGPRKPSAPDELVENMQAVVPFAAPSWELSTQPASAGQAFAIARKLLMSKRWAANYENAEQIAAVILRGREMGIGMLTALDAFHVIKGKVCTSSQLLAALAERDPNHEYTMVVELDARHAVVEIKHRKQPKPTLWTYTIEQADMLGLTRPSPKTGEPSQWVKRPETMLLKTARANGHRFVFPGATLGLHSIETEADSQHLVTDDG